MNTVQKKSWALRIVLTVVSVAFAVAIAISVRRFFRADGFRNAETREGHNEVAAMAIAAARCAEGDDTNGHAWRGLPPTSAKVPLSLASVAAKKYQSSRFDWQSPAWSCMGFSIDAPQYFQYRWTRTSETDGVAEAAADLDGDGEADILVAQPVHCAPSPSDGRNVCASSPLVAQYGDAAAAGLR